MKDLSDDFPICKTLNYLNAASIGPIPDPLINKSTKFSADIAKGGTKTLTEEREDMIYDGLREEGSRLFKCDPNDARVGMWWWEGDDTICVVNNYLNKTLQNIEDNGKVSFVCYGKSGSFQIKCEAKNKTEGSIYEKGVKVATDREKPYPGRSTVACKIVEVYQGSGGKGAGNKLA